MKRATREQLFEGAPSSRWAISGYLLFFLMLFLPTSYRNLQAGLLGVVLVIIVIAIWRRRGRIPLHPIVLRWTWLLTCVGVFYLLLGIVRGHPGATALATVFVLWPWLYLLLVAGLARGVLIRGIFRVLSFSLIAIGLYSLHYILFSVGLWPASLYLELDLGQGISFGEGYMEYNLYSISSLIFLVPFTIAAVMIWPPENPQRSAPPTAEDVSMASPEDLWLPPMPIARKVLWIGLILGLALVLLSGRRALMLVVALAPAITIAFQFFLPRTHRRLNVRRIASTVLGMAVLVSVVVAYLQYTYALELASLMQMFFTGFDFTYEEAASIRSDQFSGLIEAWKRSPILGSGLGATAEQAARENEMPWSYELQYVSLLFHTGIIGILFYGAAVGWIFLTAIRIIRARADWGMYLIPILVGMTCFLISNATNQYLVTYYYIWTIFLPVAVINLYLLTHESDEPPRAPSARS